MARNETMSLFIDEVIRFGVLAALTGTVILAPNALTALDKPLATLAKRLGKRDDELRRSRELKRVISYMKTQGYLVGDYEHGLTITPKAKKRLQKRESEVRVATPQEVWDKNWRIILYDIPNTHASARQEIRLKLRRYGCFHLQRSVLITPFPCFEDIAALAQACHVENYLSYFETSHLANDTALIKRFAQKYPATRFY
ncbi:MAG: hypothetical protein WAQ24_05040 [Candidatus Saccharimonadales bacterium]